MGQYSFQLSEQHHSLTKTAVMVSGSTRSGTTIMGKIVATLKGLEYHYEPPFLYVLLPLLVEGQLPEASGADLLRGYLLEELLAESAQGRKANLRPKDDSLILNQMTWPELLRRWTGVNGRVEALRLISEQRLRIAFKIPGIAGALDYCLKTLPESKGILMARDGRLVVRSMLKKGWGKREFLEREAWPFRNMDGKLLPYWLKPEDAGWWDGVSDATRACYTWRILAESELKSADDPNLRGRLTVVRYEELLKDPQGTVAAVAHFLAAEQTPLTRAQVAAVEPPPSMSEDLEDFFPDVDKRELERFVAVNARWGYRTPLAPR